MKIGERGCLAFRRLHRRHRKGSANDVWDGAHGGIVCGCILGQHVLQYELRRKLSLSETRWIRLSERPSDTIQSERLEVRKFPFVPPYFI